MKFKNDKFLFLSGLIAIAVFSRLIPHPPNVTPVGAVALFGTASFQKKWYGFFISLTALFLSDIVLGLHKTMIYVYLSFALIALMGLFLRKNFSFKYLVVLSFGGSFIFYIITNFGLWHLYDFYPKTAHGLWLCYLAGLPYFKNTLLGDLGYNLALFGITKWLNARTPLFQKGLLPFSPITK